MQLYGNVEVIKEIKLAILKPSTSYIFSGSKGLGKYTTSRLFAKKLLCMSKNKEANCNCFSCARFDSGNHPDFIEVKPDGNSIKVNQIRELIEHVYRSPILSERKVFIIDDADTLTVESQNALLKTLEDSFEYVTFIFVAHNGLLPTIVSRSITFDFAPLPLDIVANALPIEDVLTKEIILSAVKGIGRGMELYHDDEFIDLANKVLSTLSQIHSLSLQDFLDNLGLLKEKGDNIFESPYFDEILNIVHTFIFDAVRYKVKDRTRIIFKSLITDVFSQYENIRLKSIDKQLMLVNQAMEERRKGLLTKDDVLLLFINLIKEAGVCVSSIS